MSALEEPALRAQHQDLERSVRLVVVVTTPHVGEPVYECFRYQKPLVFDSSLDLTDVEDWLKKIQRIFTYMGLEDHEIVACAVYYVEREALYLLEYVILVEGEN